MKKSLLISIVLLVWVSCHHKSNTQSTGGVIKNDTIIKNTIEQPIIEVNKPDSIEKYKSLIPNSYFILQSLTCDIDNDKVNELILHCSSDKKIECELVETDDCFVDELLIFKNNNNWKLHQSFSITQPLINDTNSVQLEVTKNGVLSIKQYFRPTCCSGISRNQYYSYQDSTYILDSLKHSVDTKNGSELYSWSYQFNYIEKTLHFNSSFDSMSSDNSAKYSDTIVELNIETIPTISEYLDLETILPEDIEMPMY